SALACARAKAGSSMAARTITRQKGTRDDDPRANAGSKHGLRPLSRSRLRAPREELVDGHAVDDPRLGNPDLTRGSDAVVEKSELVRGMRIGAERDEGARLGGQPKELDVEVLAVGVPVDLDRAVVVAR